MLPMNTHFPYQYNITRFNCTSKPFSVLYHQTKALKAATLLKTLNPCTDRPYPRPHSALNKSSKPV